MRLPGLVVAVALFVSPTLLAQHSSGGGSTPNSSSSNSSNNSPTTSSSSSSSSVTSHSTPSAGSGSSASPLNHTSGSVSHGSTGSASTPRSNAQAARTGSVPVVREPDRARAPDHHPAEATKSPQSEHRGIAAFLRHPFRKPAPKVAESDLRRPVCKGKLCPCPPGEVQGKNGSCVASIARNTLGQCQPGEYWNGKGCSSECAPHEFWNGSSCRRACTETEYWNGLSCVTSGDCAAIRARAAPLVDELRGYKGQMQTACANNPAGHECGDFTHSHDGALQRYRSLLNEAPLDCRASLPDPSSL